ncbi:bifunctional phosphopantothenoylcysteine decarboxylase/phosphopantothenate--cysteine ligase CoaBC [Brevibacterium sp. CFH 10365]|uniref:bifunctional phosphopantothenoylcysteine decarboxylase/phosphopantothenate--cysteine ligase CoaBC n=1 Tax=Brevibacterium sp. CFH 10365 TaxID=2585207 RepID=UPI00126638E6|nr:bifunctional phosphopantothenoylcysteine decarboxylase/phosphopantothenate--cysteine ligase CoaBC [Brevibacterium sp. CFH 10365]
MRIVLGVAGGIAAYKAAHVIRRLRELDHSVKVVPTANALKFIGAPTLEALSGQTVTTDVFDEVDTVNHVRIGQEADLVIIAPATADLIAKITAGMADDLLTATVLTTTAEVVVAPAMHTEMWLNPATVANIATLRSRGIHVLDPAVGRLTGPDSGPGRLPEPDDIVDFALSVETGRTTAEQPGEETRALSGRRIVISAGGTREALDPVRFLGNRSSGKQGIALAKAAHAAGSHVELVAANIDSGLLTGLPAGITITPVESTLELQAAMHTAQTGADAIIMAAAVADYRPAETTDSKMKKSGDDGLTLRLVQNPDILRGLVDERSRQTRLGRQIIVGFAAETGDADTAALDYARAKFRRKGVDLLVFNDVSDDRAFGHDDTMVQIISAENGEVVVGDESHGSKDDVSQKVIAALSDQFTHVESTT